MRYLAEAVTPTHSERLRICGVVVDPRTQRVIVVSAIDNLVKGAAGQAVQNMNLMLGFDEAAGLNVIPLYP